MSDQQAETREQVHEHQGRISALKANYGNIAEVLGRIEKKLDTVPEKCPVGKDHDIRIGILEGRPEKKRTMFAQNVGTWVAIIGVPLTIFGLIIAVIFR